MLGFSLIRVSLPALLAAPHCCLQLMLSGPVVGSRGVLSEDLVNLQAWEGPVLLASRCGLFSAPALPVGVVPPAHVSASPLRSVRVCV